MKIAHKCNRCGVPLELNCSDECPEMRLEHILPLVCCSRCGDFRKAAWRMQGAANHICHPFWMLKYAGKHWDAEPEVREKLSELTRKFADRVCKFYCVQTIWEPEFVQQLIDHPEKAIGILDMYERGIARMAKDARVAQLSLVEDA